MTPEKVKKMFEKQHLGFISTRLYFLYISLYRIQNINMKKKSYSHLVY